MRGGSEGRKPGHRRLTCSHGDIQGLKSRRQLAARQDGKEKLTGGLNCQGQARALVPCRAQRHRVKEAPEGHTGAWNMHI